MARFAIACWRILAVGFLSALAMEPLYVRAEEGDGVGTTWQEKTVVEVEPSFENWTGTEGYRRVISLYSGITWSPLTNLRQDGLRFRVVAGGSLYRYSGRRYDVDLDANVWEQFAGTAQFVDAMIGWQFSSGPTTVKAFVGYEQASHLIVPFDPETTIQGASRGIKGTLEVWHNWSSTLWSSLDVSATRAHDMYDMKLRTGWRTGQNWSFGPEASIVGHSEGAIDRLGLFTRFEDVKQEFTVSGGVSRAQGDSPGAYGAAQYLRRF